MFLVRLALRRPFTVVVLALSILLGAFLAVRRAPVDIFPDLGVPVVYVVQPYAGMSPTQMEGQIVGYYEYHFLYLAGIEHIESRSIQGMAMLKLYFHPGTDIAQALAQVTAMAFRATSFMPPGTLPPFIVRFDAGSIPAAQLVFSSDTRSEAEIQDLALYRVRPMLATLPGVSAPPPSGGKVKTIMIYADPAKMREYGVSADELAQTIAKENLTLPAGNVRVDGKTMIASTNAMVAKPADLANIPLRTGAGPTVFVRDVGRVEDGADVVYNIALVNGRRTVYMPITKRADASTLDVVNNVKAALPKMRAAVPDDIKVDLEFDQSTTVTNAMRNLAIEGALGAVLTALMVLLFLRNWRAALIVAVTIPFSLFASFIGLRAVGQTVNIMTLGGLALSVGVLVDEATVAVENIHAHLHRGKRAGRAVVDAMREVMVPRLLALFCVLAVFIPSFFMVGIGKALFPPLALAVGFSMIASFLLSSTLVPVLAVWLFRGTPSPSPSVSTPFAASSLHDATIVTHAPNAGGSLGASGASTIPTAEAATGAQPTFFDRVRALHARTVNGAIRARVAVSLLYLGACAAVVVIGAQSLGTELFPRVDTGQFQMRIRAPDGTQLERTEDIVRDVDKIIRDVVGDENVSITLANIGNPPWTYPVNAVFTFNSGPHEALLLVALKNDGARDRVDVIEEKLRATLAQKYPQVKFSFEAGDIVSQVLSLGSPTPIAINVAGNKLGDTRPIAEKLAHELAALPALRDVQIAQSLDYPTFNIDIDRERAGQLGVGVDQVGRSIVGATSSSVLVQPAFWVNPANGQPYRVSVRVPEAEMSSADDLRALPVMPDGASRPILGDVASIVPGKSLGEVDHWNSQRMITVTANVAGNDLGAAGAQVERTIANLGALPKGVTIAMRGQAEQMRITLASLREGLLLAVVVVLLLLIASYQSVRDSLAVLSTVPAVLAGVAVALFITRTTLDVQSLMGAIMSIGVSVANALLVVTFARHARGEGADAASAAVDGASARLRPILMTTLAMIIGMVPMSLGLGEGGAQTAPLGRAVIGGLAASLFATLLVLPAMYTLIARAKATTASLDPDDPTSSSYEGGAS